MADEETLQGIRAMFDTFVELAAGRKVPDSEKNVANEKAITMLIKDALGDRYKKINETSVYPIHRNKTKGHPYFNKVERDVFCSLDYFADLAACRIEQDEKCKRPPRTAERVLLEAKELMKKVADKSKEDHTVDCLWHMKKASATGTAADVTSRLTDVSKYTGAHKERFDASGKGKGIGGREYRDEHTGYVQQYKGQGTYK